ncbi:DNA-directed RNA polymerase sigma-70 factor [Bowmanella pacifica]|uniref:DNA-directed RNA polymerase sigma-70 factor n=2 Tax=Bowmanella pacifica TaxID=502051 RepID=A0A917YWD5_9ALTE|nr:DNA-directed RNA polymerase sigma-70 factor [Bowmanella pacifica]
MLSRVAASYEANTELRKELLQEIYLAVWQAMASFRGQSSEKTYVLRIAHNRSVSHVATQMRHKGREDVCIQSLADDRTAPEDKLMRHNQQQALLFAVRKLPLQSRQVVTLFMEGLSYQEIAEVCGISTANAGMILNRARQTLSKELNHE